MPDSNYSFNLNPNLLSAFNSPSLLGDTNASSLNGIGYDPTSLAQIQSWGLPNMTSNSAPPTSNLMTDIFGKDGKMGYANTALNLGQGLFSLWSGYQGLKQMRESAKLQRDQFAFNKAGLTSDYNSKLENKQRNMIAGLGGSANAQAMGVASIADQMKKYGV